MKSVIKTKMHPWVVGVLGALACSSMGAHASHFHGGGAWTPPVVQLAQLKVFDKANNTQMGLDLAFPPSTKIEEVKNDIRQHRPQLQRFDLFSTLDPHALPLESARTLEDYRFSVGLTYVYVQRVSRGNRITLKVGF